MTRSIATCMVDIMAIRYSGLGLVSDLVWASVIPTMDSDILIMDLAILIMVMGMALTTDTVIRDMAMIIIPQRADVRVTARSQGTIVSWPFKKVRIFDRFIFANSRRSASNSVTGSRSSFRRSGTGNNNTSGQNITSNLKSGVSSTGSRQGILQLQAVQSIQSLSTNQLPDHILRAIITRG